MAPTQKPPLGAAFVILFKIDEMRGVQEGVPEAYKSTMTILATQTTMQLAIFKRMLLDLVDQSHR